MEKHEFDINKVVRWGVLTEVIEGQRNGAVTVVIEFDNGEVIRKSYSEEYFVFLIGVQK